MRYLVLDAKRLNDREAAHDYLAKQLGLPEWYGRNLDALADCLGEMGEQTTIILTDPDRLDRYGKQILGVFEEMSSEAHAFAFFTV